MRPYPVNICINHKAHRQLLTAAGGIAEGYMSYDTTVLARHTNSVHEVKQISSKITLRPLTNSNYVHN